MNERKEVFYTGRVQGVGFRYTVVRLAAGYPAVTGFVRNLPDGRVHLVAEGDPEKIDGLLERVRTVMASNIRGVVTRTVRPTGEFEGFGIR